MKYSCKCREIHFEMQFMPILRTRGQRLHWLEPCIFLMMCLIPETTNGDTELIKLHLLLRWYQTFWGRDGREELMFKK